MSVPPAARTSRLLRALEMTLPDRGRWPGLDRLGRLRTSASQVWFPVERIRTDALVSV